MSGGGGQAEKKKKYTAPSEKDEHENVIIPPRDLKIAWGSDDTQWEIEKGNIEEESYAEAIKVTWLEVKAIYKGAKAGSKYRIGFKVGLKPDAFGWDNSPVFLMAKVGESGSYAWKRLYFNTRDLKTKAVNFPSNFEINIPSSAEDTTLYFGLYEIWGGRWKGGLRIYHAFVNKV
ncbi:protein PHLOEM PROTEIN 2-LIKE A9-like [Benincasa hispida]|uniref:protein PHLOEM PROTEIN 2-LIKE A9-like n=1 Tax=Benincasa hispida TaxID=102211 RepID=UPI0018FF89DF|nr:protein PHLOEM PROTEIN 2-LIKE A9-like [Benincasa hispida]